MFTDREKYTLKKADGFCVYHNNAFYDALIRKMEESSSRSFDVRYTRAYYSKLQQNALSSFKLHISLHPEDFKHHKKSINQIIISHLNKLFYFPMFKVLAMDLVDAQDRQSLELLNLLFLHESESATSIFPLNESIRKCLQRMKIALPENADAYYVMKQSLYDALSANHRFKNGDQYTIYLTNELSNADLISLCSDIERYIKDNKLRPGKSAEISSKITNFIHLRCDRFNGKYIPAIISSITTNDDLIARASLKEIQENSSLYLTLKDYFSEEFDTRKSLDQDERNSTFRPIKNI